jgi:putative phage-type endonuclease
VVVSKPPKLTATAEAAAIVTAVKNRDRRKFLGGSDAAAVMGLSPWKTPVELWMFKTGRTQESLDEDTERLRRLERGKKLEPFILDMTLDKLRDMGLTVEHVATNALYTDPEHPWMACEIDFELKLWGEIEVGGRTVKFNGEHINADAKSVGSSFARKKWGIEFTEDVPVEYATQFMHGLMVTGRQACLISALRSFDDVDLFWTLRDDEVIAGMRQKEIDFWHDHVLADVPPDPFKFSDVKFLFPSTVADPIEATPAIVQKVKDLLRVSAMRIDLEAEEDVLKLAIADYMRPHASLTYGWMPPRKGKAPERRVIATWNEEKQTLFDKKGLAEKHPEVAELFTLRGTNRVMRAKKLAADVPLDNITEGNE